MQLHYISYLRILRLQSIQPGDQYPLERTYIVAQTILDSQTSHVANLAESQVYLASPYTVAASAVAGHITDPRPFLMALIRVQIRAMTATETVMSIALSFAVIVTAMGFVAAGAQYGPTHG